MSQVTQPPPPPASPVDPIIGIDLGTTNSLVAYCDSAGPRIIPDEQGRNLLPSVVRINPQTGAVDAIGHEARAHAVEFPRNTIFSIKRLMGRGMADAQGELAYLPYQVVEGDHHTARVYVAPPGPAGIPETRDARPETRDAASGGHRCPRI
jgi:molecular chaperone DnaK (HSP70)